MEVFWNEKRVNQYPWRRMKPGDVVLIREQVRSRAALAMEARRTNPNQQFWSATRPEGVYIWIPTAGNPYPIPPRPVKVKPVDPVKRRRAERRAWHRAARQGVNPFI